MSPTRVDFYLLSSDQPDERWLTACRLLEKAYLKGHQIFVVCENRQEAELLDHSLWTFKKESFIPHSIQGEESVAPIQIAYNQAPQGFHDIVLNLSPQIPPFYNQFQRVIELVGQVESEKKRSRIHYKTYQADGCKLYTHSLNTK